MTGGPVTGELAAFLEANRDALNQAVIAAGRQSTAFDPAAFAGVLRDPVAPIVDAVEAHGAGFTALVSRTLFDAALELVAQGRFDGAVRDGWTRLLPVVAPQLVLDPLAVVAAVSNALDRIGRTPGARPDEWIDRMVAAAPLAPTVDALLAAGQVAGWRSGLAAYRDQALAVAASLDPALAAVVLGVDGGSAEVDAALAQLRADPWFDPAGPAGGVGGAAPILAVGSFRGFGGTFVRPPTIVGVEPHVRVSDGSDTWFVFVDAFGSAVVRAREPEGGPDVPTGGPVPAVLADVAELTGWAPVAGGFVATSGLTHAVLFAAVRP